VLLQEASTLLAPAASSAAAVGQAHNDTLEASRRRLVRGDGRCQQAATHGLLACGIVQLRLASVHA